MKLDEYSRMADLEEQHWWYRGLRDAIQQTLSVKQFAIPAKANILDAGCGTGGNLRFLQKQFSPAYLGGFDLQPLAVEWSRKRVPAADVYESDICYPQLHVDHLDLILSCDVIYIPGVEAALDGLLTLVRHLRPGGLLVVNLPAYNWLFSEHDVVIHTRERYTAGRVRNMMRQLDLDLRLVTYRVCTLFPAVVMARLPSIVRKKPPIEDAKSNLHLPSRPINTFLASILRFENSALRWGVRFPWGSSVFAVGKKIA